MRVFAIAALLVAVLFHASARGENWPGWRGPRGDGTSIEAQVPTRWDGERGENIVWKVPIAGNGHASPVVWEDRIFLVSCLTESLERVLMCLDRASGETLWQRTVIKAPLETKHSLNSYASSTPATDGRLVYVTFLEAADNLVPAPNVGQPRPITPGKIVVAAYDFDGQQRWLVRVGDFVSAHGFCSCPVLFEDLVIINGDHDGDSYVVALNRETGDEVWRVAREHKIRSYVTPLIREIDGRTQMVFSGSRSIVSLDPRDGSRHWSIQGPTEQFVASMVYDGEKFYMAAGFPTYHVMGIRPDGSGDVTDTHVAWHSKQSKCYVPSPVVVDKFLFVADDRGTASCYDTATGQQVWEARLGRHFSASLVAAGGFIYFIADDGVAKLVTADDRRDVVAENPLGEYCYASPAISDGQLFIRGERHLFCIGPPRR